jgi:hypothetical protein
MGAGDDFSQGRAAADVHLDMTHCTALALALLALTAGCYAGIDPSARPVELIAADSTMLAALEAGSSAWADAGVQAPAVSSLGEPNVLAVSDDNFEARCMVTRKTVLACTSFGPTRIWVRESLLQNPTELRSIVTHEMGHVMQGAHARNNGHLTAADGCVDGAPNSPHMMCAWSGPAITSADVALMPE